MPWQQWDDRNTESYSPEDGNRHHFSELPQVPYEEREEIRKTWPAAEPVDSSAIEDEEWEAKDES